MPKVFANITSKLNFIANSERFYEYIDEIVMFLFFSHFHFYNGASLYFQYLCVYEAVI